MTDAFEQRLAACFAAAFPNRSRDEILSASRDSIEEWDSLAAVTLLALIQQEFGATIDLLDFEELSSFQRLLEFLQENATAAGGNAARG